jgi:RNA polymerase sigma-70 factor, ECF subfamily
MGCIPSPAEDTVSVHLRPSRMTDTLALDRESAEWLRDLQQRDAAREDAVARLHAVLLRAAQGEAFRRRATLPARAVDELNDLCVEAASDALMAILGKLETYRGAARFTTWACKFAILETSSRLRRLAWRQQRVELDDSIWDRLPDRTPHTLQRIEHRQLLSALRRAVEERLSERQRFIFQSVTMDEVPIDVLAERLGATRGAIYKTLHDARAKLRRALVESGHEEEGARR